jgi:hypothetical protein
MRESHGAFLALSPFLEQRAALASFNFNFSMFDQPNTTFMGVAPTTPSARRRG